VTDRLMTMADVGAGSEKFGNESAEPPMCAMSVGVYLQAMLATMPSQLQPD